mmetsp:Transcript_112709/g.218403  ORF Transcript_112709/g.218403 Transcript_112709/m.218403 type:complete len:337 (+) Transcript_112709:142-1152(+)
MRTAKDISCSSTSDVPLGDERGSWEPTPRWMHGCYSFYMTGLCNTPVCNYLHDLSPQELAPFLKWANKGGHKIYSSDEHNTSNSSEVYASRDKSASSEAFVASRERFAQNEMKQSINQRFTCMDEPELRATLPPTRSGQPSSIGSMLHASGQCRPCRFFLDSVGCRDGIKCHFCHMEHRSLAQSLAPNSACSVGQNAEIHDHEEEDEEVEENDERAADVKALVGGRKKFRPYKSKRGQYAKDIEKVKAEILQDPLNWNIESIEIPAYIANHSELSKKFLDRLAAIADQARSTIMPGSGTNSKATSSTTHARAGPSSSTGGAGGPRPKPRSSTTISL